MSERPGELLAELAELRHRTRADRHGHAFPLLLFGVLVLAASLLYAPGDGSYTEQGALARYFGVQSGMDNASPNLVAWYWLAVTTLGVAATTWWYHRRGVRTGVETDTRGMVAGAAAGLGGLMVGANLLRTLPTAGLYSNPAANLPILFGAAGLAGLGARWSTRPARTATERGTGLFVTALLGTVALAALGVYLAGGMVALIVIAVVLLALTWLERDVLLGVVGALFTLAAVPANHQLWYWDLPRVFSQLGWSASFDARVHAVQTLLVPGLILVVGGAVAALTRHGSPR